ncbi:MAG: hypothetical protein HY364_02070 [Candidatus Aenigmarchaeota archaeon]|nr:hypothetical protein [Candidatus Aenigmarchaeota archaeon]
MNPAVYRTGNLKVDRAIASLRDGRLSISLLYPNLPETFRGRLPQNPEYGITVMKRLKEEGVSAIADEVHPIRPPCAGIFYMTKDGKIISHRRDIRAPTHALYHSIPAGHPTHDEVYLPSGLYSTAMREAAEECLIVTKDDHRLLAPVGMEPYISESAKKIGLQLPTMHINAEIIDPSDTITARRENGDILFVAGGFVDIVYESETNMTLLQGFYLPIHSDEIEAIDAEGMNREGRYERFGREIYFIDAERPGRFGSAIKNPRVRKSRIDKGMPFFYTPDYTPPYKGPDLTDAGSPHVFAPDNLLSRALDAVGAEDYAGKWMEISVDKMQRNENK